MSKTERLTTGTRTFNPFSPRTILLGIIISLMSFGAVMTLLAWAPELSDRERADATAYSIAATGYNGLVQLLEKTDTPVSISRSERNLSSWTHFLILTPSAGNMPRAKALFGDYEIGQPVLIILPKWSARTNNRNTRLQASLTLSSTTNIARLLDEIDETASINRLVAPASVSSPYGRFRPHFEEKMQIIESDYLVPVIPGPKGMLLAQVPDQQIFILADPDLANTFNLDQPENARLMLSIVNDLRGSQSLPVVFDATMNGFSRSTSLLKILLDVPFLGATLVLLMAAILLLWSAFTRFGAPARETQIFALGKEALADNTAGLISMTGRERKLAPDYLALSRKAALKSLGITRNLSDAEINALLERADRDDDTKEHWAQLRDALGKPATSREDLLQKARRIYRWRKEKFNGHK
jgi:hypothetical protein